MDKMIEEYERGKAVDTFREIVEEMKESDIQIPSIDRITTFNDKEVIINFFDKFFTIYEVLTYESDGEQLSNLAAVALGRHRGDGSITLIDFRYIGQTETELFKEGINTFLEMVDRTRMKELPPTELHEGGNLEYEEIIQKIVATYLLNKPPAIH